MSNISIIYMWKLYYEKKKKKLNQNIIDDKRGCLKIRKYINELWEMNPIDGRLFLHRHKGSFQVATFNLAKRL